MIEVLSAWLAPLLLLLFLGAGVAISTRQMRSYGRHLAEVKAINDDLVAINPELIAERREIKAILKDRA